MNKKKLILYISLTIISLGILLVSYIFLYKEFVAKDDGKIYISLVELDGTIVNEKEIEFNKYDTLLKLLRENYDNVVIENGFLMSIDSFTTPSDYSTYISIYVDNEMSNVGVLGIEFTDGTKITFKRVEYNEK